MSRKEGVFIIKGWDVRGERGEGGGGYHLEKPSYVMDLVEIKSVMCVFIHMYIIHTQYVQLGSEVC